jgi:hypothetical protein
MYILLRIISKYNNERNSKLTKRVAAMPDEATARSIFLSNLTFANSKFIRNILPVPPGAPKNSFSSLLIIDDNITS